MEKFDFTIVGEKVLFKYNGVAVMVDFTNFDPEDKPLGGVMKPGGGVVVVVKEV